MTQDTTNRHRIRSVAAVVLVLMLSIPAGFGGTAAAQQSVVEKGGNDVAGWEVFGGETSQAVSPGDTVMVDHGFRAPHSMDIDAVQSVPFSPRVVMMEEGGGQIITDATPIGVSSVDEPTTGMPKMLDYELQIPDDVSSGTYELRVQYIGQDIDPFMSAPASKITVESGGNSVPENPQGSVSISGFPDTVEVGEVIDGQRSMNVPFDRSYGSFIEEHFVEDEVVYSFGSGEHENTGGITGSNGPWYDYTTTADDVGELTVGYRMYTINGEVPIDEETTTVTVTPNPINSDNTELSVVETPTNDIPTGDEISFNVTHTFDGIVYTDDSLNYNVTSTVDGETTTIAQVSEDVPSQPSAGERAIQFTPETAGEHTIKVVQDGTVKATGNVTTYNPVPDPQLSISTDVENKSAGLGETVTINSTVENTGNAESDGDYKLTYSHPGGTDTLSDQNTSISVGSAAGSQNEIRLTGVGNHTFTLSYSDSTGDYSVSETLEIKSYASGVDDVDSGSESGDSGIPLLGGTQDGGGGSGSPMMIGGALAVIGYLVFRS